MAKAWVRVAGACCVGLGTTAVMAEVAVRGLRPEPRQACAGDPAGTRVVLVGDSVSFGYALAPDDTLSVRLAARLPPQRRRHGPRGGAAGAGRTRGGHGPFALTRAPRAVGRTRPPRGLPDFKSRISAIYE